MSGKTNETPQRRDVLKVLGLGGAATGAAAVATTISGPAEARETRQEARKARYQPNSAHVQAFYRTNRY
jgi:sugar (pentulose or hexulose) kinase